MRLLFPVTIGILPRNLPGQHWINNRKPEPEKIDLRHNKTVISHWAKIIDLKFSAFYFNQ